MNDISKIVILIALSTWFFSSALLQAQSLDKPQTIDDMRQAIAHTVINNPEIRASWFAFKESVEEQRAAKGGYYPSVDVTADAAHIRTDDPASFSEHYSRRGARFTITQMLFDGFATHDEVARLRFNKLASYYRMREASEDISLDVVTAYLDVYRYQKMVSLAERNYVEHRVIYNQIEERTRGGVSRGVDLEQANARLALAESNLLTEMTNLHDVRVRFQRITSLMPAGDLQTPVLSTELIPATRKKTLAQAYFTSPLMNAAIEDVRATQEELNAKNAPMMPRFDLRFRRELDEIGEDLSGGLEGRYDETAIELVMTYNLYRGGADSANKRRLYQRLERVRELRIKACRDVRQNVMISYNDISALQQQLVYAGRNQLAISKAKVAYQAQFDLGQRTLLDQLDTENEFFDAHRTKVNAETDLVIAQAQTLAKMGLLLAAIEVDDLSKDDREKLSLDRGSNFNSIDICPIDDVPASLNIDKDALFEQLMSKNSRIRIISETKAVLTLEINFAHNSSDIISEYDDAITDAVGYLKDNSEITVIIEGHTDSSGSEEYNQRLSELRAEAVKAEILKRNNVSSERLLIKGYGELMPVADNDTAIGRGKNRRIELIIQKHQVNE